MIVETTEEYMARKGIPEGAPLVDVVVAGPVVESQVEYLARKATEAEQAPPKGARAKK